MNRDKIKGEGLVKAYRNVIFDGILSSPEKNGLIEKIG
jgi:hypothetical protein